MKREPELLAATLMGGVLLLWLDASWTCSAEQLVLFTLAAAGLIAGKFSLHPLVLVPAGAAAIGVVQIAAGWTIYCWHTDAAALDWFARAVAFALAYLVLASIGGSARFLSAIRWSAALLAAAALLLRFSKIDAGVPIGRMGPFLYENQFAAFVELTMPLVLLDAMLRTKGAWIQAGLAAVMLVSVFASGSVAGTLLVIAETLVILAVLARKGAGFRRMAFVTAVAALLACVNGWQLLSLDLQRHDPYRVRREMSLASIGMIRDRPWTGFGLGNWAEAQTAYTLFDDGMFDNQAHNDWLQWGAEGGIPLLLLMGMFAVGLARPAWRSVWGIGLLAVLAHALVDYPFQQRPALGYLWFALAGACLRAAESERG